MVTKNEVICESIPPPPTTAQPAPIALSNDPTEIPSKPIPLSQVDDGGDDETKENGTNMISRFNIAVFILLAVLNFA